MLFNTFQFAYFFALLLPLYWMLPRRPQNCLLLAASYYFYACWDPRFLTLLILSTVMDYACGLAVDRIEALGAQAVRRLEHGAEPRDARLLQVLQLLRREPASGPGPARDRVTPVALNVVLPIGISFYTFQSMSYVIDVYRKDIKPTRNFIEFATFVSFFPHLVAGPIMRPTTLLPQVQTPRRFNLQQFYQGAYLIFWGLTKKVVVADNLAARSSTTCSAAGRRSTAAWPCWRSTPSPSRSTATSRATPTPPAGSPSASGFELALNFNLPYFATSPQEFWAAGTSACRPGSATTSTSRWAATAAARLKLYRNLMLTMIIGGLWHGAAWTFVLWGTYQGVILVGHRLLRALARPDPPDRADRPRLLEGRADRRDVPPGLLRLADLPGRLAGTGPRDAPGDRLPPGDPGVGVPAAGRRSSILPLLARPVRPVPVEGPRRRSRGRPGTSGASSTPPASTPSSSAASSAAASSSTSSSEARARQSHGDFFSASRTPDPLGIPRNARAGRGLRAMRGQGQPRLQHRRDRPVLAPTRPGRHDGTHRVTKSSASAIA